LRELYEIADSLGENIFRDSSGTIVFAEDLKGAVAVGRQIIATIGLSISSRYRQGGGEIVCEADIVQGIVSPGA